MSIGTQNGVETPPVTGKNRGRTGKKSLQTGGTGIESQKRPTRVVRVVDQKPYGKSRLNTGDPVLNGEPTAKGTMKTKLHSVFVVLAMFASVHPALAQVTNLGIAPAPGGQSLLYWPNSPTNYVLQTVTNLTSTNWVTARTAFSVNTADVTNSAPSGFFRLMPTTTPAGMALIPAGWFLMGDSADDNIDGDAAPTNIYVSAFVMDVNLVNYGLWTNV